MAIVVSSQREKQQDLIYVYFTTICRLLFRKKVFRIDIAVIHTGI